MLTGHGAINGREFNSYEINAGVFAVELDDATAAIAVVARPAATIGRSLAGLSEIRIQAVLGLFKPPTEFAGIMGIQLDGTLRVDLRQALSGITATQLDVGGMPSVRASLVGDVAIDPSLSGIFDRSFIGHWPVDRRITVAIDGGRVLYLQPEPRGSDVPIKVGVTERQKDDVIK